MYDMIRYERRRLIHSKYYFTASEEATNNIPHKLEIEYGSTPGQKLDILGTDLPNGKIFSVYTQQ